MLDYDKLNAEFDKFIASQTKESLEEWIAFDKKKNSRS